MSTKKNNTAAAMVNTIVETAFVPNMEQKQELTYEQKKAAYLARKAGKKVTSAAYMFPSNGEHTVIIHTWELKFPTDGDIYYHLELKEPSKNIIWMLNVTAEKGADARKYDVDIMDFLNEISAFNKNMLFGKEEEESLNFLCSHEFTVWTQQYRNKKGEAKCQTFSNPNQYEYWARREASKRVKAAQSSNDSKAPWEE